MVLSDKDNACRTHNQTYLNIAEAQLISDKDSINV